MISGKSQNQDQCFSFKQTVSVFFICHSNRIPEAGCFIKKRGILLTISEGESQNHRILPLVWLWGSLDGDMESSPGYRCKRERPPSKTGLQSHQRSVHPF